MELLLNVFTHLSREIQIYILSGFLIISNFAFIDYFYFDSSLINYFSNNHLIIISIIFSYIIGHLSMGLFYLIFEKTGIDKKFNPNYNSIKTNHFIDIYNNNPKAYSYFIERYDTLTNMRCTLCTSCLVNAIVLIPFLIIYSIFWQIFLALFIFLISSFVFYSLSIQTEKELKEKINTLFNKNNIKSS